MEIGAIAAVSDNGTIGSGDSMLWHYPEDLKRFKDITMGKVVIMGRKSYEQIKGGLPGRHMIIVSRTLEESPEYKVARSIEDALQQALLLCKETGTYKCWVAGGAQIYEAAWPYLDSLNITFVPGNYEGVKFPFISPRSWVMTSSTRQRGVLLDPNEILYQGYQSRISRRLRRPIPANPN